jgi:hypothetical protein
MPACQVGNVVVDWYHVAFVEFAFGEVQESIVQVVPSCPSDWIKVLTVSPFQLHCTYPSGTGIEEHPMPLWL